MHRTCLPILKLHQMRILDTGCFYSCDPLGAPPLLLIPEQRHLTPLPNIFLVTHPLMLLPGPYGI